MIDLRRGADRWRQCDVTVRDLPFALLLTVLALLPGVESYGTQVGGLPARPIDALGVAVVALECLPLALRRRWPAVCLVLVAVAFVVDQTRGYHTVSGTALAIAVLSAAAHLEHHRHTTKAVATAAYVGLVVVLVQSGGTEGFTGYLTFYLGLVLAWGIGAWLRLSRAAEADRRRLVAETTRTAERTRIARDLHDVVTHHVTAMVVQAQAARYLPDDRRDETLAAVADAGRQAITDLRHLLDVLDPEAPRAGEFHALVTRTRLAGQPVEFTEEGEPVTGGAGEAAYRVVQEALTNAVKHAHGSPTTVLVRHVDGAVTVEVGTASGGSDALGGNGSGRGLTGLRDRVDDLGGEFSSGRHAGGRFVVRARIPVESRS